MKKQGAQRKYHIDAGSGLEIVDGKVDHYRNKALRVLVFVLFVCVPL